MNVPVANECADKSCKKPRTRGRARCETHLKIDRDKWRKIAQARRENGLCALCGVDMGGSDLYKCSQCRMKQSKSSKKRAEESLAAGLCRYCKVAPLASNSSCQSCIEKRKVKYLASIVKDTYR